MNNFSGGQTGCAGKSAGLLCLGLLLTVASCSIIKSLDNTTRVDGDAASNGYYFDGQLMAAYNWSHVQQKGKEGYHIVSDIETDRDTLTLSYVAYAEDSTLKECTFYGGGHFTDTLRTQYGGDYIIAKSTVNYQGDKIIYSRRIDVGVINSINNN